MNENIQQQQRGVADHIDELTRFINGPKWNLISRGERARLVRQLSLMEQLDHVLLERIGASGKDE